MSDINDIIQATLRNRTARLADNIYRNNVILKYIQDHPPPPRTMRDDLVEWSERTSNPLAFWPQTMEEDDYDD